MRNAIFFHFVNSGFFFFVLFCFVLFFCLALLPPKIEKKIHMSKPVKTKTKARK